MPNDNCSVFIIDSSNTPVVGDRPAHIVQNMTIEDLASLWDKGENSFSKDPSNVGMYMAKKHGIVVLKSLVIGSVIMV